MGQRLIDDNGGMDFVDDNGIMCFVDDNGNFTCAPNKTGFLFKV
jgi:hypothetical protein